jgi:hypothetical protein
MKNVGSLPQLYAKLFWIDATLDPCKMRKLQLATMLDEVARPGLAIMLSLR